MLSLPLLLLSVLHFCALAETIDHCAKTAESDSTIASNCERRLPTASSSAKQPVIIDTDIGSYDDDPVAIALALSRPELDVKLVITCSDDTTERARIAAKYLTLLGRDDVPIGIGVKTNNTTHHPYWSWASNYDLSLYKGPVYSDGVAQMAKVILTSPVPVDIILIGPSTNVPMLVDTYPDVVKNARVNAMSGSVYRGYDNSSTPVPETNVKACPLCFNKTLSVPWKVTITPTDTSGIVICNESCIEQLLSTMNPLGLGPANTLTYFCLLKKTCDWTQDLVTHIFDSVAVLLSLPSLVEEWLVLKEVKIFVTQNGSTVVQDNGTPVSVAVNWEQPNGLSAFVQFLIKSIT